MADHLKGRSMPSKRLSGATLIVVMLTLGSGLSACAVPGGEKSPPDGSISSGSEAGTRAIVGTWIVRDSAAPFPYHMYVFNADGTMQQANPDAGDPSTSDSDGKGVWVADGTRIKGKWVELTADRTTHKFVGRTEISYVLGVDHDVFTGDAVARFYDSDDRQSAAPLATTLKGKRIKIE